MRKTTLAPGQLLHPVHIGEKLPQQGGLPCVVQLVTRLSKLLRGNKN